MELTDEIFTYVKEHAGMDEQYEVTHLFGYRTRSDGATFKVNIEIRDSREPGPLRWHVYATDEEGRVATGNSDSDLKMAILTTHWTNLDVPDS